MPLSVKVSYNSALHRFTLPRAPTFLSLCESLVQYLHLPVSALILANPARAPFALWFLDDERDYCRLFDDLSLREALRLSPNLLRLSVTKASASTVDTAATVSAVTVVPTDPLAIPPQFSSASLLKLLSYLRTRGSTRVKDDVEALYRATKSHAADPPALREVRHDLASLFSNFFAKQLGPATEGKVDTGASVALQKSLKDILEGATLSKSTIEHAVKAVRTVSACRAACDLLRARYTVLLTENAKTKMDKIKQEDRDKFSDNIVRPVKHYLNQFVRLMRVAGKDPQNAYEAFAVAKRIAEERGEKCQVTRRLCKGVQRACLHFLKCHVTEGEEFGIETRAINSLASAISRKLGKAGYDESVLQAVRNLVEALAKDPNVLRMAYDWAKKPEKPVQVPKDDDKDLPEVGQENEEWGDWHDMVRHTISKDGKKKKKSRDERSSGSRSGTSKSERDSKDRFATYRKPSRGQRYRDDNNDSEGSTSSSGSIASMREEEWTQSQRWSKRGGQKANMTSPMDSSDERYRRNEISYANDPQKSSDTQRSQWARIEMEKEKKHEQQRKSDGLREREQQMEREQRMENFLAKSWEQDDEPRRRADGRRYRSQLQSYGRSEHTPHASYGPAMYTSRSHQSGPGLRQAFNEREPRRLNDNFTDDGLEALEYRLGSERRSRRSLGSRVVGSVSGRGSRFGSRFDQRRDPPRHYEWGNPPAPQLWGNPMPYSRGTPMPQPFRNPPMPQPLRNPPMPQPLRNPPMPQPLGNPPMPQPLGNPPMPQLLGNPPMPQPLGNPPMPQPLRNPPTPYEWSNSHRLDVRGNRGYVPV